MLISSEDQKAIEARLHAYLAAFEKGDAEAYAEQFTFPACIWDGVNWIAIPDRETCLKKCQSWVQEAREAGAARGATLDMRIIPLLSKAAVNQLSYQRVGPDGRATENIRAAYLMLKLDDGWKIATVVGESEPTTLD